MTHNNSHSHYPPPVDQLLRLGKVTGGAPWHDYAQLGITREHTPDLIRLATDPILNWTDENSQEVWGPLHAWRALAQLGAVEASEALVDQIDELRDDEWFRSDLPDVMVQLGPRALPALQNYLHNYMRTPSGVGFITALECVERIGTRYLEAHTPCQQLLLHCLDDYTSNDATFNSYVIHALLELRARRALPTIAAVFEADCVDDWTVDWYDVRQAFRLSPDTRPQDVSRQRQ